MSEYMTTRTTYNDDGPYVGDTVKQSTTTGMWNTWPYTTPVYYYHWPSEPTDCVGKAHVFECDHEPKCKCGKVERVMPAKGKQR